MIGRTLFGADGRNYELSSWHALFLPRTSTWVSVLLDKQVTCEAHLSFLSTYRPRSLGRHVGR